MVEDLLTDWSSPYPRRMLDQGDHQSLHPLSELPHPIITKATEIFGTIAADDNPVGPIASSTQLRLMEVKIAQWRGGIWVDPATGVRWLVVAGLANGDHEDHDDFYKRVEREDKNGTTHRWLPTDLDDRLLKRKVHAGGTERFAIDHPIPGRGLLATLTLSVAPVREPGYQSDDIVVEVDSVAQYAGQHLVWELTVRALVSLNPPQEGWDRYGDTYSNIAEPGDWTTRVPELEAYVLRNELVESEPGQHCHYTHRQHIAGSTIQGSSLRALCGAYFVPHRDHTNMPVCPICQQRYATLPR